MYPIITENEKITMTEYYMKMPDGIGLYTRAVVPKGKDKYPIVFIRDPYEKRHYGNPHDIDSYNDDQFINNGFAVVLQHCRGVADSEGECHPYTECDDGLNSLEQIRNMSFYNGEIYVWGLSYLASSHIAYLHTNPRDIKGIALDIQTDRMYYRYYRNGCNYNFCNYTWWFGMIQRRFPNVVFERPIKMPYKDMTKRMLGEDVPEFTQRLLNDTNNEFWAGDPRVNSVNNLNAPILLTDGWYDFYIDGMFDMWSRVSEKVKDKSAFIVGPWGHATKTEDYAEYKCENGNIPDDRVAKWFKSIRENTTYEYAKTGMVNYYSIGGDYWTEADFPENKKNLRLYLDDEKLSENKPEEEKELSYRYNPEKPMGCFKVHNIFKGFEKNTIEGVLSFETDEFTEDCDFYGNIRWHGYVKSDCDDTAFYMRVYFVENGEAYNLTETILRLSYFDKNYKAGDKFLIDILTPPIAFSIKKGDKIRLDIASNGGAYVPHANVKGHWAEVTEQKIANNTVIIDENSYIEIPTK